MQLIEVNETNKQRYLLQLGLASAMQELTLDQMQIPYPLTKVQTLTLAAVVVSRAL